MIHSGFHPRSIWFHKWLKLLNLGIVYGINEPYFSFPRYKWRLTLPHLPGQIFTIFCYNNVIESPKLLFLLICFFLHIDTYDTLIPISDKTQKLARFYEDPWNTTEFSVLTFSLSDIRTSKFWSYCCCLVAKCMT